MFVVGFAALIFAHLASSLPTSTLHAASYHGNVQVLSSLNASDLAAMHSGESYLVSLLSGWHNSVERDWPRAASLGRYNASLHVLLALGVDPSHQCPTMDAAIYRNQLAMGALLGAMTPSQLHDCLSVADVYGSVLAHHVSSTSRCGLARLLFRARKHGQPSLQPQRELSTYLGLAPASPAAPLWQPLLPNLTGQQEGAPLYTLTAAALEAAMAAPELPLLSAALRRAAAAAAAEGAPGHPLQHLLGGTPNVLGRTALHTACADGRAPVVAWLLSHSSSSSELPAVPELADAQGLTCAHYAVANDDAAVLHAMGAAAAGQGSGSAALAMRQPSAWNVTPCQQAALGGRMTRQAHQALVELGVCGSNSISSSSAELSCPPAHPTLASHTPPLLQLPPSFSAAAAAAAGWRVATPAQLQSVHLPRKLLALGKAAVGKAAAAAAPLPWAATACPAEVFSLEDILAPATPSPPAAAASLSAAGTVAAAAAAAAAAAPAAAPATPAQLLAAHLAAHPRPILLRPLNATAAALAAAAHFGRRSLAALLGGRTVETGRVPYARAYGESAAAFPHSMLLRDFLRAHMPRSNRSSSHLSSTGAAALPPLPPPYVFDAQLLRGLSASPASGTPGTPEHRLLHTPGALHALLNLTLASAQAQALGLPPPPPPCSSCSLGPPSLAPRPTFTALLSMCCTVASSSGMPAPQRMLPLWTALPCPGGRRCWGGACRQGRTTCSCRAQGRQWSCQPCGGMQCSTWQTAWAWPLSERERERERERRQQQLWQRPGPEGLAEDIIIN